MKSRTQSGVALVITLLMLSVITFLTVAFLAISRRDRASVGMSLTQREARNMADAAAQRAQADIVMRMISTRNIAGMPEFLNYDLMVSRNYISTNGFDLARNPANGINVENVSYEYRTGGVVTNNDDLAVLVGNLFYDPRPPVFIKTNADSTKPLDLRFWVDVNRNGRFETNGRTVDRVDGVINYAAEPEWIGMLRNPEFVHSATNPFIGRYAYLVAPIGKTLDWNYIHNFAKSSSLGINDFQRNQGVGSWEINLAGLLASANTNIWTYRYSTNGSQVSSAFDDAASVLRYRYNKNKANLANARTTLGPIDNIFAHDMIDSYAAGPLQMTTAPLKIDNDKAASPVGWSGSDNPAAYYDPQEMFDPTKTSGGIFPNIGFTNRLYVAGTGSNSYNRYTMARLLASIGTGSEPELQVDILAGRNSAFRTNTWDRRTKVNLNYANTNEIAKGLNTSQTNYQDWTPLAFFTNAADLILRSQFQDDTNFTITNLWVYSANTNRPDIRYSSKIHRCLQLAANLYDATTGTNENLPSVFRPIFKDNNQKGTNHNVYIVGFEEVTNNAKAVIEYGFRDITNIITAKDTRFNVWGIPWVIGAKKGLPNFNEFVCSNSVSFERKLQFWKTSLKAPPTKTNQMYILAMTNYTGIEVWNSYRSNWNRDVFVIATNEVQIGFTNENGVSITPNAGYISRQYGRFSLKTLADRNLLRGFTDPKATNSLWIPLQTTTNSLPYSRYDERGKILLSVTNEDLTVYPGNGVLSNHTFGVSITNRFFYAMIDDKTKRLIDFVNLGEFIRGGNLSALASNDVRNLAGAPPNPWLPGRQGISNQIAIALGTVLADALWDSKYNGLGTNSGQTVGFSNWWNNTTSDSISAYMASPFQPLTVQDLNWSFEANDPLVHYTKEDLTSPTPVAPSIGAINGRASNWRGTFGSRDQGEKAFKLILTDPQIACSDDWDFPTNKYPNVGWIGRVHRGTPWQTIYLKPDQDPTNNANTWRIGWAGSLDNYPTNDWVLPDLFTVAPNDNAARGTLSVNQTNLAAWSAIFSGVIALKDANHPVVIDPTDVPKLVDGINRARAAMPGKVFHKTGEILAASVLTTNSPFIGDLGNTNVTDAVVERIPQQVLSLLKVGQPRFVIWAYGQSLKPQSVYMGAKYPKLFGIPTNYQITGESLTRTVCRLEYGNATNIVPRIVVESFNVVPGDQ